MNLKTLLLASAIALPVQQQDNWQLLQYSSIPSNETSFTREGMEIRVERSASPIIYPLEQPRVVRRVEVEGILNGLLDLDAGEQGDGSNDDFTLRVGLVVAGDKTLGGLQKLVAADWIKTLYGLAPEGAGVENIYFLNAVQSQKLLGQERQHPLSDLIYENNVWLLDQPGKFDLTHTLETPRKVLAVWISIDGDNTKSSYSTLIQNIRLES